jgi:hypothetical protein
MSEVEPYQIYTVVGTIAFLIVYFLWSFLHNRGKIKVRIRRIPEEIVYKSLGRDSWIIMEPAKRGKTTGWKFEVTPTSLIPIKSKWLGTLGYAVEVYPQATKAIEWPSSSTSEIDPPQLTAEQAAKINAIDGFRRRYGDKPQGAGSNILLFAILAIGIINIILMLRSQGVIRF